MSEVLERDRNGRETLWRCRECAKPFTLGWGDLCNACIAAERRHRELLEAIRAIAPPKAATEPSEAPEREEK